MLMLHPTQVFDLRGELAHQRIVSMTVGPTNRLFIVSCLDQAPPESDQPEYFCTLVDQAGRTSFSVRSSEDFQLSRHWRCHELPDGRLLWMHSRASRLHPNGYIMRPSGEIERRILLGDGISSLQVAPSGAIWVGYFDEGLFGNRGWFHENGGVGIVALDDQGTVVYECTDLRPHNIPSMIDSCRVNVLGDDAVWYLYEHEHRQCYPVIAVQPAGIRHVGDLKQAGYWHFAVGDAFMLAVNMVAKPHGFDLFPLPAPDSWLPLHECALQTPDGQRIEQGLYAARGSMLWLLADRWIYGFDVNAIKLS